MARSHYWAYVQNSEGQPVDTASISIYLAGTATPAFVYSSEYGGSATNAAIQTTTNSEGFFEFWIADSSETNGYAFTQKFKINWIKAGVLEGFVDYVDVWPVGFNQDLNTTDSPTFAGLTVTGSLGVSGNILMSDYTPTYSSNATPALSAHLTGIDNQLNYLGKNLFINPNMRFWQRGTTIATLSSYLTDRWFTQLSVGTTTRARISDGPDGSRYCTEVKKTDEADAYARIRYRPEVNDLLCVDGQDVIMSFWAKGQVTNASALSVTVRHNDAGEDLYSGANTVITDTGVTNPSITTSWQKYEFTWNWGTIDTSHGYEIIIDSSSTALSTNGDYIRFAQFQLERGLVSTDFEDRSMGADLALCQRYYWRKGSAAAEPLAVGQAYNTTNVEGVQVRYPVPMRSTPTRGYSGATDFAMYNAGGVAADTTSLDILVADEYSADLRATRNGSGLVAGNACYVYIKANGWLDFSAEL